MKELISIVVSCYNEEESIPYFYDEIRKVATKMDVEFEFLFIDDGSKDATLKVIKDLTKKDKRVKYISFSRNFGKEAAMKAGLNYAKGDFVALMDADLQDPPKLLIDMYMHIKEDNYDVVATRRVTRIGEPKIRSFFAKMFYKLINKMSDVEMVDGARDFRLMKRCVVDAINSLDEYNRYSKGIFSFVGFKTKWITYENVKRVAGKTKWSFFGLFKYAIEGITSFSTFPLVVASFFGFLFCFIAFLGIIFVIIRTIIYGDPVSGWPSLICIILLVSGVQLLCLGIIGKYLSKTYLETKKRPLYFIADQNINN